MAKKVGLIGSGVVATTLADGFIKKGWEAMIGTREPSKMDGWRAGRPAARAGSVAEAAAFGELLVLAVKGPAAEAAVEAAGPERLAGKVVLDACNPIAEKAPVDGVLQFFTGPNESLMERLQAKAPKARFVKAFSCVGNGWMVDPVLPGGPPTMFICGNDPAAKAVATGILKDFGWEAADMGSAVGARAIEPLAILWCIPGMRDGRWDHAFKLLRGGTK